MSPELSPIIFGVGIWAASFITRYSIKSSLRKQTFNRKDIDDGLITDINLKDTMLLKNIIPITIGLIGIVAGICSFTAQGDSSGGPFLISMGAAHLIESMIFHRYIIRRGVK